MTTADIKSRIAEKIERLSPDLLAVANEFLDSLLSVSRRSPFTAEVEVERMLDEDPLVGLIDGSPDLASNAEDILQKEIKSGSGWTWRQ